MRSRLLAFDAHPRPITIRRKSFSESSLCPASVLRLCLFGSPRVVPSPDAASHARLPPLVRGVVLGARPAFLLPLLDVLGGTGRLVPALALLGRAHRALRPPVGQGAGSARHGGLHRVVHRDRRDPRQAVPLPLPRAAPARRPGPESAAAGPVRSEEHTSELQSLR